jgi:hypothetical protein
VNTELNVWIMQKAEELFLSEVLLAASGTLRFRNLVGTLA